VAAEEEIETGTSSAFATEEVSVLEFAQLAEPFHAADRVRADVSEES
jgi:hypothetical protein